MNFSDEYKSEMNDAMPDERAMERIRRGVAERLSAAPKRKPFSVRRMAAVCGSAAAGLIIVSAAVILNSGIRSNSNNMNYVSAAGGVNGGTGSNMDNVAGIVNKDDGNMKGDAGCATAGEFNNAPAPPDPDPPAYSDGGEADAPMSANEPENATNGSERSDDCLPGLFYGDSNSGGCSDAMIGIADNGVILTINGTVTRFTKYNADALQNANAEPWDSEPAAAEYDTVHSTVSSTPGDNGGAADNVTTVGVSEGSGTESAPGDCAPAGVSADLAAPDTETGLIKVTADNGETMFIKSDGNILWLYNIDYELLGVFIEIE